MLKVGSLATFGQKRCADSFGGNEKIIARCRNAFQAVHSHEGAADSGQGERQSHLQALKRRIKIRISASPSRRSNPFFKKPGGGVWAMVGGVDRSEVMRSVGSVEGSDIDRRKTNSQIVGFGVFIGQIKKIGHLGHCDEF